MFYLIIVFLVLVALELVYFRVARRFNITDKPGKRSSHTTTTLRGGGILFYFGALLYFISTCGAYPWFMAGLTLIAAISFADDIHSLPPRVRLIVQFASILLMFGQTTLYSTESLWAVLLLLVVCAGIINVFNFMDGINGITGGYALVTLLTLLFVNAKIIPFVETYLIIYVILAVLVFCFFNFRRRAKCFAGDVGSVSIAFIILFLLLELAFKTHDFSWVTLLVVYGVDGVLTIVHRILLREKISQPHRKHAFQILANEVGLPHAAVSLIYMVLQLLVNLWYLNHRGYLTLLLATLVLSVLYILFILKFFYHSPRRQKGAEPALQEENTNTSNTTQNTSL